MPFSTNETVVRIPCIVGAHTHIGIDSANLQKEWLVSNQIHHIHNTTVIPAVIIFNAKSELAGTPAAANHGLQAQ